MRAILCAMVVAGCSTTNGPLTFSVVIAIADPTVDSVRAYDETFPVVDHVATVTTQFPAYVDGVEAGVALVELLRGQVVIQSGSIAVGACATCDYELCPSLDSIDEEEVRYTAAEGVSPHSWDSFVCTDGDHSVFATK